MYVIKNVGKQTFLVLWMWKEHVHSVNSTQERLGLRTNTSRMPGKLEKLTSLGHGLGALLCFQAEVRQKMVLKKDSFTLDHGEGESRARVGRDSRQAD